MAPRLETQVLIFGENFGFATLGPYTQGYATFYVSGRYDDKYFVWAEGLGTAAQSAFAAAASNSVAPQRAITSGTPKGTNLLIPEGLSNLGELVGKTNRTQVGIAAQKDGFFLVRFIIDLERVRRVFMLQYLFAAQGPIGKTMYGSTSMLTIKP